MAGGGGTGICKSMCVHAITEAFSIVQSCTLSEKAFILFTLLIYSFPSLKKKKKKNPVCYIHVMCDVSPCSYCCERNFPMGAVTLLVLYCVAVYCIVLRCIVLRCVVLCCVVPLYCVVLYCVVLHCVVLCCIALCCIVLRWFVLHCAVLCYVVLYKGCWSHCVDRKM